MIIQARRNDIYGIYAPQSGKRIRFVSNLAIDDEPLANAACV